MTRKTKTYLGAASALAMAISLASAGGAMAQTSTSTLRGSVRDGTTPEAGATVVARESSTGFTARATVRADGSYVIPGLRPGSYDVSVTTADGQTASDVVSLDVASVGSLDLDVGATSTVEVESSATDLGDVVVTGRRLVEVRTSEVATNISAQQLESIPQTDRNFLSFARLAPGVSYNDGETSRTFRSGASTASAVNVFIDGASLKSQTLPNGVSGQDSSRGNPFAQLAVQEFRVLTQNYKAEYEQAAAAIITAVTRSGTNEFHGEVFGSYQDRDMIEDNFFDDQAGREKPEYKRMQYGASLGGPIIQDRLHFFVAYEGNDQDRASTVTIGNRTPANIARFGQYEGNFVSPFRADLFFGKLSWSPDDRQVIDLSATRRIESDISSFGGTTAFTAAEDKIIEVNTINLRHTYRGDNFLNEASIDYIEDVYNPTSLSPGEPTLEYNGIILIGGKDSSQYISREGLTLRDDLTITAFDNHVIKMGLKYTTSDYSFNKLFFTAPKFNFRSDIDPTFSYPQEARLGLGDPSIDAENWIFGGYIQDDWDITPKLQLNLGIRWDYEDNLFNNDYVTPANAAAALRAQPARFGFDPERYITDGNDRPRFQDAFQPRVGFSYDIFEDESTVLFGGYGKYYDRNVFNDTLDERFRLQYAIGTFYFSRDGLPRDGNPTVVWNESYRTAEGLNALRASAQTGLPELFAVPNDAKPPSTDQFSLGVRQKFGDWNASLTATYIEGQNGYTHIFATRNADGSCCATASANSFGYANIIVGVDELETKYYGLYATLDKPYTASSGWGLNVAYTYGDAKQNGGDLFSLDAIRPSDYGFYRKPGTQLHNWVISGIKDLPWGIRASGIAQLGSGNFYTIEDASLGFGFNQRVFRRGEGRPNDRCFSGFAFCTVDLKFEKEFEVFGQQFALVLDIFNATNSRNFDGYNGFIPPLSDPPNANFGQPSSLLTRPRSIQVGFRYSF
jgi:outer membrane receptor protein involved in Fe transport